MMSMKFAKICMYKDVLGVEWWSRQWRERRESHDRVRNWDVGITSMMDLNIIW
jgi:hypothetical protein